MKSDQASVAKLLQQWDHGSKNVRSKILQDFIASNQGKTGPELDLEFAHAASLFLTRLTAWLRLTYPFFNAVMTVLLPKSKKIQQAADNCPLKILPLSCHRSDFKAFLH